MFGTVEGRFAGTYDAVVAIHDVARQVQVSGRLSHLLHRFSLARTAKGHCADTLLHHLFVSLLNV